MTNKLGTHYDIYKMLRDKDSLLHQNKSFFFINPMSRIKSVNKDYPNSLYRLTEFEETF